MGDPVAPWQRRMAASFGVVASWDELPKDFLDKALSPDGDVSEEKLKEEKKLVPEQSVLEKLLQMSPTRFRNAKATANENKSILCPKDAVEVMDEINAEKLTLVFVEAKTAGKTPKVLLPHPSSIMDDKPIEATL